MPLPKTASIAARATEVYSEVCTAIMNTCWKPVEAETSSTEDPNLPQLLPYLRQLLTCCACAGLLDDAMVSLSCGHCYCYECQFRPPLLKIQCRQCRERTGLVIENQLRLVVECYKKMCLILADHFEKKEEEKKEPGSSDEPKFDPIQEIMREIQEGTRVSRAVLTVKPPAKYLNVKSSSSSTSKPSSLSSKSQSSLLRSPELGSEGVAKDTGAKKSKSSKKKSSSCSDRRDLESPLGSSSRCHTRYPPATSSEEEIDITSLDPAMSSFSPSQFQKECLEVSAFCLNQDFVSVTPVSIKVKDLKCGAGSSMPTSAGGNSRIDGMLSPFLSPLVSGVQMHKRSRSPLSPRIKRRKVVTLVLEPPPKPSHTTDKGEGSKRLEQSLDKSGSSGDEKMIIPLGVSSKPRSKPHGCRCGTNHPMFFDKICARYKCPCYSRRVPCRGCHCRHCNNPYKES